MHFKKILLDSKRTFSSSPIAFSYVSCSRTCCSDRWAVETRKKGGKTARQCRQLEKRRNSWSVSDIIVVVGVSGMGRRGTGRKERGWEQTHAEENRCRSHMHRDGDGDDDTIWSFAPHRRHVTISRLRATCYTGDAMLGNCLRLRRRTQPPIRVRSR